ncbi:MAG: serine/threonine protein kinase [Deltaproteobacteria bacterium]|nr:serine/threonine protein kinase [Deltaproteobacteria bacterium]
MGSLKVMDLSHLIGQKVGTSTLLKEIARGNMGAVFVGYQGSLKRQIAVKVLPKSIITERNAKTFQQEAELAAILSHPNIIPVYEVGDAGDFLFLAMQLVKGRPLSYYIQRSHKNVLPSKRILPLKVTFSIIISVLNALDYAHSQLIIHRDVKPGNILIEEYDKRPIIVDFGLAKVIRKADETASIIVGTPLYMAPEQITKPEVDGRADIYASATMLLEMLTPPPLFPNINSSRELIRAKIELKDNLFARKPSERNPDLNKEMDRILTKALSFEPEGRYSSCREFREELEEYSRHYLRNQDPKR